MGKKTYMTEEEVLNFSEEVLNWYNNSKSSTLTIISVPFNTSLIFKRLILDVLNEGKNILYVWGKEGINEELVEEIKKEKKNTTTSFIEEGRGNYDINFVDFKNICKVTGEYEIVIIDDISNFSELNFELLKEKEADLKKISKRIINYVVEEVSGCSEKIEVIPVNNKKPFVEPRILTTRIDLNNDIPVILYDYLKWFAENKSKVIIFVPDEEKLNSVYMYYTKKLRIKRIKIVPLLKNEEKDIVRDVLNNTNEATIIITNCLEENLEYTDIGNAIILFADNEEYTYKKLLYICGQLGMINKSLPEVLLVSKDISLDMDKVKDITREYNRRKWIN